MADAPQNRSLTPVASGEGRLDYSPGPGAWKPAANPWLIAVVVAMAAFMEVLDTSIANVALPYMAGNLGASTDQSTWILTSYLVSNAIVLPISGWLSAAIGRKRYFMISLSIFTISSFFCGIAPSLTAIIVFRVLQGAGGGGLQPMAQAIMADTFPAEKRGMAFALYSVAVVVAPTIGPALGGWITDSYTWRWIFFINIPVGAMALLLVYRLIEDPPWMKRLARGGVKIDYIGVALLSLGVGALQVMLDKGQEDDWFGSHFIVILAVVAAVCLISLVVWEWRHKDPIVDVRMFKNMNFLACNAMMFALGIMLFAALVMMPLFLQTLMGYSAESAGLVLSTGGIVTLSMMPVAGTLVSKFQARYLIAFGWLSLAFAMFFSAQHLDLEISFWSASQMRVLQVVGLAFLIVPITLVSYVGMPAEKSGNVAGLVNFMRNIGSSIGTSMVATLVARRAQVHQVYLAAHIYAGQATFSQTVHALAAHLVVASGADATTALERAYGIVYQTLIGQATAMAYIDTFWVLATASAVMFVLSFTLRKNQPQAGGHIAAE